MNQNIARLSPIVRICLALVFAALALPSASLARADQPADYALSGGWFFTQTGGGGGNGYAVRDTGADANGQTIKFWTEFQRLGGIATLGYPVGGRYVGSDGFTYQPFQRALLQWRPELGRAFLSNTFEILQSSGKDDWLFEAKGTPRPISDDGSAGDYAKAVRTRLGWLTNDAIKAKFQANPNPSAIQHWDVDEAIQLYGLPMSAPEQHGPFIVQRFQRISFQLWTEDVPGMPAKGAVVGILGGDLLKEAGLLPANAVQPLGPNGTAPAQPAQPTPPPAPSYGWYVASMAKFPNCGFTYIRAYTRDANGNGVNGMALKSWNDYGNEYVAGSRNYQGKDGYWDRIVGPGIRPGRWYVVLVDGNGNQASDVAVVDMTESCDPNQGAAQEVEVIFQAR